MSNIVGNVPGNAGIRRDRKPVRTGTDNGMFRDMLNEACSARNLHLTGHARDRIARRDMHIVADDLDRISHAMDRIAEKGGARSVIFCRDMIFITDARQRAIITAMNSDDSEKVLTGIDSAVVI